MKSMGSSFNSISGPHYFHPDEVEEGRQIMTEWVGQVYEAVKSSGSERELAISIPSNVETCLSRGLDPQEWLRQGIVNVLIAQALARPELRDPNGTSLTYEAPLLDDLRSLVESAKETQCRIHAAIDSNVDSDRLGEASIEMIRAAACNYWAQGIDGLYISQWFTNWPYEASFYEKLRELPHPDIMAPKDKFYHIPTVGGRFSSPELTSQLPADLEVNVPAQLEFTISDDLPRWERVGRVHEVLLRVRIMNTTENDQIRFQLNSIELPTHLLRKINEMYRMRAPRYRTGSGYWFVYQLDPSYWPQKGNNVLEVTLLERDPDVIPQCYVRDVELEIKYLPGKHFHRD